MADSDDVKKLLRTQDALAEKYQPIIETMIATQMEYFLNFSRESVESLNRQSVFLVTELWADAVHQAGPIMMQDIIDGRKALSDTLERIAIDFLTNFGVNRVSLIGEATAQQMRDAILRQQRLGYSREEIIRNITNEIPSISELRAKTIVGTEIHTATQFASHKLALQSAVPLVKTWNTVADDRTRRLPRDAYGHLQMHGTRIALNVPFRVPTRTGAGESLLYPGDPTGSPGNVINCRCTQTYERA